MTVAASAPGKVILLGEYAVLAGAPALVAAVDRRATATIEPESGSAGGDIRVLAPDLGIDVHATIGRRGAVSWAADATTASKLHLVASALRAAYSDADMHENSVIPGGFVRGYTLTLSTRAFFDAPGSKLGLGSSAALTVALTGALHRHLGLPQASLAELVRLHRTVQGGRGSGVDIGAAHTGGVVIYTGGDTDAPAATPVTLPPELHWCCVFTGRSASTPRMLAQLRDWRRDHVDGYAARMTQLAGIAHAGARAVRGGDLTATLDAIGAYTDGLDALGRDAAIDIMSAEHRDIRNAAVECGVIYKPSGAGGGDIGIGVSGDPSHIDGLRRALSARGYRMIDVAVDAHGLTVESSTSERQW
jgi:phosphomevalonate kinase